MKEKSINLIFKSFDNAKYSILLFVFSIVIINIIFYSFQLPDDRANTLKSISNGWLIGDFTSYDLPFFESFKEFLLGQSKESIALKIGPFLPALILISKKLYIGNLLIQILALTVGISNILLIHKIIPKIFTDISGLDKFKYFVIFGKKIRILALDYFSILGFSLNPLILYYFAFPSTDSFFSITFFIILLLSINLTNSLTKSKYLSLIDINRIWIICFTLLLGMLIRPTAILNFFLIIVPIFILIQSLNKYWRKLIFPSIFILYILVVSSIYYLPYANLSNQQNREWTNGISLWNTPLASKNWEKNKLNNLMAHTLSFPFKFAELSGLRPSYVTTHDDLKIGAIKNINKSKKPFFYTYLRSNWAFFIVLPSESLLLPHVCNL